MKPTARTCHATRTLLELAHHGQDEPMRASTLCVRLGISSKLLEKIVRPLKEAGLVKSVRGATGGYMLAQRPEDISLGRVLCVMEGAVFTPQCCESDTDCQLMGGCPTGRVWIEISRAIEESFNATTLAGLMATPKQGCPGETARAKARAAASQNPSLHDGAEPAGTKLVRRKRPRSLSFVPRLSGPRHSGRSRFSAEKLTK